MAIALFLKSRIKGHWRQNGVFVREHYNKVQKKADAEAAGAKKAKQIKGAIAAPRSQKLVGGSAHSWEPATKIGSISQIHPKNDDEGKPLKLVSPSEPTDTKTWANPKAIAVFVPGGQTPESLNGVAFSSWTNHPRTEAGWNFVQGQMPDLDEPEMELNGKDPAAGVVIEEPDGRVWMVKPSNGFAGYTTTFPKGHADAGLSLQATAIKETFEESGLQVEITGLIGDVERGTTTTRYYRAKRIGGTPAAMGWESQAVVLAPKAAVHGELNRDVDRDLATIAGIKAPKELVESIDDWKKVGNAAGSNPGGFFVDPAGHEWYVKVPKTANIAKNEILAAKLYAAAGVLVPELKEVSADGKTAIASRIIDGLQKFSSGAEHVEGTMDGFAVDAWLANWDVVGLEYDNLLADEEGRAVRVDVGGSLLYRAQGEPKGKAFGDTVGELETLTNGMNPQSASVFGHITHAELIEGIDRVASVSEAKIRALTEQYGPGTPEQRGKLAETLIARRAYLIDLAA